MEKRIYRPLEDYTLEEVKDLLESGTQEQLMLLPLSLGQYFDDLYPGNSKSF